MSGPGVRPVWSQPRDRADEVVAAFGSVHGRPPDGVWAAPGRVNLIGEHTDYNGGLCLPIALPHSTFAAVSARSDDRLTLRSLDADQVWSGSIDQVGPGSPPGWPSYVAGVLWALRDEGLLPSGPSGVDVVLASAVPVGAGLSSSAALECAVAVAVDSLRGTGFADSDSGRAQLAHACVRAENVVAGAPTGGMDQAASLRCTAEHALLLDTRDGSGGQVPLSLGDDGLSVLVVDTRAPHQLTDGHYARRRASCEQAARLLGVSTLREIDPDDLDDALGRLPDDVLRARVRHVVTEIARVIELVALLRAGRAADTGPLLDASHTSLRDDYEVSCRELDLAVTSARAAGALGARMTGGGFGGSAIALVRTADVERVAVAVSAAFAAADLTAPHLLLAPPSAGAHRVA